jgi:hypothetical protein
MMRRRRRWAAPVLCNPTAQAKQIWRYVYGEPWPTGWKVKWVGFMRGAAGLCQHSRKRILLSYGDAVRPPRTPEASIEFYQRGLARAFWNYLYDNRDVADHYARNAAAHRLELERERPQGVVGILIHEFTHVRNRGLKHGVEFDRLVKWGWDRLRP